MRVDRPTTLESIERENGVREMILVINIYFPVGPFVLSGEYITNPQAIVNCLKTLSRWF